FILSKGNIGLAQMIYRGAQLKVIGSGNEIITGAVLSASVPVLVSHTEEYKDTPLPGAATEDEEAKWLSASNEGDASAKIMAEKSLKSLIPGDIDRPQHKEFVGKIDEVLRNFDEKILSLDHDLVINRTAEKKNTYDALQRCGLINIDPLNKL
ncbi:TPA: ATP-binding protein, partial [Escherichia coli]